MTLELEQQEMQTRSRAARKKQQSRNRSGSKKGKNPTRPRESVKTLLKRIAVDSDVGGRYRVEACKILLVLDNKLAAEVITIDKEPEQTSSPATTFRGSDLEPAKPV